jgi:hypothetical protein
VQRGGYAWSAPTAATPSFHFIAGNQLQGEPVTNRLTNGNSAAV